jgi:hypothetical protein
MLRRVALRRGTSLVQGAEIAYYLWDRVGGDEPFVSSTESRCIEGSVFAETLNVTTAAGYTSGE